jgi:acetoin:2,6-dichlorophenolindophenol oxidoreductase subunit alpha
LCECLGREDGYSKGRGGKMHMGDLGFGILGDAGTVGGTVPTATGAALAAKIRGSQEVVMSFFGDGAANQGVVHESMNLAGVWKLPVIYVCENNQYAMTVSLEKSVAIKRLSERAAAQPIPPPHSPPLVEAMIPDVDQVIEAVMRLAEGGGAP